MTPEFEAAMSDASLSFGQGMVAGLAFVVLILVTKKKQGGD